MPASVKNDTYASNQEGDPRLGSRFIVDFVCKKVDAIVDVAGFFAEKAIILEVRVHSRFVDRLKAHLFVAGSS